jgi:serine/threonine protein kinase
VLTLPPHSDHDDADEPKKQRSASVSGSATQHTNSGHSHAYMEEAGSGVHGTIGYIAPECFRTEKATRESNVYAFGAVVLEVVCGRRPRFDIEGFHFLVDWVWRPHRD